MTTPRQEQIAAVRGTRRRQLERWRPIREFEDALKGWHGEPTRIHCKGFRVYSHPESGYMVGIAIRQRTASGVELPPYTDMSEIVVEPEPLVIPGAIVPTAQMDSDFYSAVEGPDGIVSTLVQTAGLGTGVNPFDDKRLLFTRGLLDRLRAWVPYSSLR